MIRLDRKIEFPSKMPHQKISNIRNIAPIFLIMGFSISAFVAWEAENIAKKSEYQRFAISTKRIHNEISRRMGQFDYCLRGAAAIWPASTEVTREDFSAMVEDRDLANEFPGSLGLGFVRRIHRANIEDFLVKARADGAPDFDIKTSGNHEELYVVEYLFPYLQNLAAIGYDIAQDNSRRLAADRAMLTGKSAITAPVSLVQAPDEGPSFLVLFPVYEKGTRLTTADDRHKHLLGWTYMPVIASRVFEGSSGHIDNSLDFEVFHGTKTSSENLIFDEDHHLDKSKKSSYTKDNYTDRLFTESGTIEVGGEKWTVICSTKENFTRADRVSVWSSLIGGGIITILISCLTSTLGRSGRKAEELAKQMTIELNEAVKKLKMLSLVATRTTNSVIFCDTNRVITWVNEGFTRMTGYTYEEAIGKSPAELLQTEHTNQETILLMRQQLDRAEPVRCEILNCRKSGHEYWTDLDILPLKDHSGVLTGFMSIQQDIDERKLNEESIKEQAERTAMALANGELGLWDWNISTGYTLYDERWASMLGEKSEDLKPSSDEWIRRCHPDDLPEAKINLVNHLKGKTPRYEVRHRLKHKDGSWRWIISNGKVVSWGANGRATRIVGTHRDITNRYTAQLESQRQQAALNHTGKLAKVGAWELTVSNSYLYWSDQVYAIHEVENDFIPDLESAFNFYKGEAHDAIRDVAQRAIDNGESFDIELPLVTAKGKNIWVRVKGEAFRENGVTVILHGAFQDVTDTHMQRIALDEARKLAEKASQAKAEFLANMSHEIRTPMNAVIGMSELLQRTKLNTLQEDYVQMIRSSSETLLALINDILDFSKIDSGNLELELIPIQIRDCVEYALEFTARPAAEKHVELMVWIDPDVPIAIYGDKTRLCQVIINLLSNAVKFTPQGEILISISNVPTGHQIFEKRLHFSVKDTGIGIPYDRQDRLFKSFSQVDASTTRHYGGTGLGLAICARLIHLMGGSIWVDSKPNEGSTFHFEIPFKEAPCPKEVKTDHLLSSIEGKRLLIVDDNPINLRILGVQLDGWGISSFPTASAKEALSWIDRGDAFDLAVIDVQMPIMNGYQLAKEIRKRKNSEQLPIIAVSSLNDNGKDFEGSDVYKILTKPVKSSALHDVLLKALHIQEADEPPSHNDHPPTPLLAETYPLKILLAEDMAINQRVTQLMLGYYGYNITITENGRKALEALDQDAFDIILMDVQMPEMDGLTCSQLICEKYPLSQRPWIIALTANALEGDSQTCKSAGMDDYISKPISSESIASAIIRASSELKKRRAKN